jgi:hypothetical protein
VTGVVAGGQVVGREGVRQRRIAVVIEGEARRGPVYTKFCGSLGWAFLDDRDRATLGVGEGALDGLTCLQVERRGAVADVAAAVVVVAVDRRQVERRRRVVLVEV